VATPFQSCVICSLLRNVHWSVHPFTAEAPVLATLIAAWKPVGQLFVTE